MKLAIEQRIHPTFDGEDKQSLLHRVRIDLAEAMLERLYNERWYAIRMREIWPPDELMSIEDRMDYFRYSPHYYYDGPLGNYRMEVEIREVETGDYVVWEPTPFEEMPNWDLSLTAAQEIKRRIVNKVKRLFS
jgi:hypothetical protein